MKDTRQQDLDLADARAEIPKQAKPTSIPGQVTALMDVLIFMCSLQLERSDLGPLDRAKVLSRMALLLSLQGKGSKTDTGWYDIPPKT